MVSHYLHRAGEAVDGHALPEDLGAVQREMREGQEEVMDGKETESDEADVGLLVGEYPGVVGLEAREMVHGRLMAEGTEEVMDGAHCSQ